MTQRRPWPTNALEERDNAAEEIQNALRAVYILVESGGSTEQQNRTLAIIVFSLQNALRWLEKAGARTTPTDPHWKNK